MEGILTRDQQIEEIKNRLKDAEESSIAAAKQEQEASQDHQLEPFDWNMELKKVDDAEAHHKRFTKRCADDEELRWIARVVSDKKYKGESKLGVSLGGYRLMFRSDDRSILNL